MIVCSLLGHRRKHNKVWHDGQSFRAVCRRCGTLMLKDDDTKIWRKFTLVDNNPRRSERVPTRRL
jgi:hypothetical protein